MPEGVEGNFLEAVGERKERSMGSMGSKKFKGSIPLHFDMLNATPYSLSKQGNLIMGLEAF